MARRQCKKCPWRKDANPREIPNGYCEERHRALGGTIAGGPNSNEAVAYLETERIRLMACHESVVGHEQPCVGWLAHELGPGNNLALRLRAMDPNFDGDLVLVGEQHERFEDTLPKGAS
jgi:hypothetical protein